ncbi:ABC transporter ATP-binding protein [Alginatibacterium sediminis]|uniref:ABC transporter ATP-binding protein n=1 Tax=Alginatibacterium sediminis TaxID=2164068 RepID=A0A420E860_9ALTE|nr:ABC transporter ATP-binding protein [Alginatibacterium sediminis]RKF14353.1 ABC transporter ATP-binding protein [Alginatibacterium sediminis]
MNLHLEIDAVSKSFGHVSALEDIHVNVERGSFVCLLGPSGCGKTTLLRIIAGFERQSSGHLRLNGKDISTVAPHRRNFGMVFQSLALFPHMNVAQNIAYGLKLRGIKGAKQRERVDELLHVISLPEIADRPVSALSGGQRQRVAIARALAVQPEVFLLDEPLSALDAKLRDNMQIELRQLQQQFGVTTVLVTHDQTEAMMLADQLVVLDRGRVQQCAPPSEVYRKPASAFVADFLGSANIVQAKANAHGSHELFGQVIQLKNKSSQSHSVELALRAEDIQLKASDVNDIEANGEIIMLRDLGPSMEAIVKFEGNQIRVRSNDPELRLLELGRQVSLQFDPNRCIEFA